MLTLVAGIDLRIVATRLADRTAQVVGDEYLRDTVEELEGAHMALEPVRQRLGARRLGIGVAGSTQHRHEDLRQIALAGGRIDDRNGLSGIVDEALLAGLVGLAHRPLQSPPPAPVVLAVLRVAVAAVGVVRGILLPQQP